MNVAAVSVLIVTRNRANLLSVCLTRLSRQRLHPHEIVVVDNDSTDETPVVIRSFARNIRLKHFVTRARGFPAVYNAGIRRCTGTTVVFLDDDCSVGPWWFKYLHSSILRHPGAVIQGKVTGGPVGNIYAEIMSDHYANWVRSHLSPDGFMDTCDNKNLAVPRSCFYVNGRFSGFDPKMRLGSEDIEFGLRLRRNGISIIYDPSFPAVHRERTTLGAFVSQHLRIAASESVLHSRTGYEKTSLFPAAKTRLNIRSFFRRTGRYLAGGSVQNAAWTVILYGILFGVRIRGYFLHEKNRDHHVARRPSVPAVKAKALV